MSSVKVLEPPTKEQWLPYVEYVKSVCLPLALKEDRSSLHVEIREHMVVHGEHMIFVRINHQSAGLLIGQGGVVADALRTLSKSRFRALGWKGRFDLRVTDLG